MFGKKEHTHRIGTVKSVERGEGFGPFVKYEAICRDCRVRYEGHTGIEGALQTYVLRLEKRLAASKARNIAYKVRIKKLKARVL